MVAVVDLVELLPHPAFLEVLVVVVLKLAELVVRAILPLHHLLVAMALLPHRVKETMVVQEALMVQAVVVELQPLEQTEEAILLLEMEAMEQHLA